MAKTQTDGKTGKRRSMVVKLVCIAVIFLALTATMINIVSGSRMRHSMNSTYEAYFSDVAHTAAKAVDAELRRFDTKPGTSMADLGSSITGKQGMTEEESIKTMYDLFNKTLGDVNISGIKGSYAYLVGQDGTMIYHPTEDKIGKPVDNAAVKGIVARLQAGEKPQDIGSGTVTYMFNGAKKYAGYSFTMAGNILIVTGDYALAMKPVGETVSLLILIAIITTVIAAVVMSFFIIALIKPLNEVVNAIDKTAKFDFRTDRTEGERMKKLAGRKDELAAIIDAVYIMRTSLTEIIGRIRENSANIDSGIEALQTATNKINSMCTDNSATSEELAAEMQETSATTENISEQIKQMKEDANEVDKLAGDGTQMSDEIMNRVGGLRNETVKSAEETDKMLIGVRERADKAIADSKAVDKINELTNAIKEIASQTSLLSLNASIEAARAGEAGKGFAVVADEISKLAGQTSDTVSKIEDIIGEVNKAVAEMTGCISDTSDFLEKKIKPDYAHFTETMDQYNADADKFKQSLSTIQSSMDNLSQSVSIVTEAIEGINTTINDSAQGVTDIAQKTTDMVGETSGATDKAESCRKATADLEETVKVFHL